MNPLTRTLLHLVAGLALGLAFFAPSAQAADSATIIADCEEDGRVNGRYSASELRQARKDMPADVAEYSNCLDVLRRAELALSPNKGDGGSGGGGGPAKAGGGGGSVGGASESGAPLTASSPAEKEALQRAVESGETSIDVGGQSVVPGARGLKTSGGRSHLPGTLTVALICIGLLAATAAALAARRRFGGPPRPLGA